MPNDLISFYFFVYFSKANSIVFPKSVEMSLPNVIRFVLQHSNHNLRLQTALAVCSPACLGRNRNHARRARRDVARRRTRLQATLLTLLSTVDSGTVDSGTVAHTRYTQLSLAYVRKRLMQLSKEISAVVRLLNLLESGSGTEIDPLKLQEFVAENVF